MIETEINDEAVLAVLGQLSAQLADLTPVMQDIGEYQVDSTRDRFDEGVAPDGTPWAPKSQATLDRYRRRGDPAPLQPLFGPSRKLRDSLAYRAGPDEVSWGSDAVYAAVMHYGAQKGELGTAANGSPAPWGDIPARPFLGVSDDDGEALIAIVREYLDGAADD